MKAKKIRKIRKNCQIYLCLRSVGFFGDFTDHQGSNIFPSEFTEILAKNPEQAASRLLRRQHYFDTCVEETSEIFGVVKVLPLSKSRFFEYNKYVTYWR